MIEIIKEGKKIPKDYLDKQHKVKCRACGCRFNFTYRDVDPFIMPSRECPQCQRLVLIHNADAFKIATAKRLQHGE